MCTEIIEKAFWRPRYRSGRSVRVLSWALERRLSWFSFSLSFWVFGRGWLRIFSLDYESERSDKLKLSQLEAETGGLTELRDNSASESTRWLQCIICLWSPNHRSNYRRFEFPRWPTPQALPKVSRQRHQKWKFKLRKPSLLIVLYMYRKLENLNDTSSDNFSTKLYLDRGEVKRVVRYQQCV